jgi:hypothetical protein
MLGGILWLALFLAPFVVLWIGIGSEPAVRKSARGKS